MEEPGSAAQGRVRFVAVAEGNGPAEGRCLAVVVEGRGIAIFRSGGALYAVTDRCPHNGMPLHDGSLADGVVTCRWHGWAFELSTGRPPASDPAAGGPRIRSYAVRAEDGQIWVGVPADAGAGGSGA